MKFRNTKQSVRIGAIFLSFILFTLSVFPAYATKELDESSLHSELSDLEKDKNALSKELSKIISQIETTSSDLKTVREELAIAKGKEKAQYDSMMTRIKYMYENGNTSMLEMLLSSKCITEFISRAEYFSAIHEYDRNLLSEYTENLKQITANETKLKENQEYLHSLQKELDAKEKALKDKISDTSAELAKLEEAKEKAKKAESEAKKDIKPIVPAKPKTESPANNSAAITNGSAVSYTEEDVILLAALIECEAGHSNYEALLAVGAVIVNRMKHFSYPNTLYGVIYQSGQFPPATNGKMDNILERGVKDLCITAARDALNGKSNVEDCISFRSASSGRPGKVIGSNVFFF